MNFSWCEPSANSGNFELTDRCPMSALSGLNPLNLLKTALWRTAHAMRETGQAMERLGCSMQGIYSHEEISESEGHAIAQVACSLHCAV